MQIGIDARLLSRTLTGIGSYTLAMCRALSKIPSISLRLYSPDLIRAELSGLESVAVRTKQWNNVLLRQLWSETFLPHWAKKENVDLFWGPAHRLPRFLPKQMARVVTIHDLVWKYAPQSMRRSTRLLETCHMPFAIRAADQVVADSQATADAVMREFCLDPEKLTVVPLGTRVVQDAPLGEISPNPIQQPYFLFVGTLEPRKNLVRLLEAYSKLSASIQDKNSLVIAGGKGWGGIDLAKHIDNLGLKNRVRLLGFVSESTLSALYENCSFLVMPSLYEGFGLPIIDAMSYGKSVLTSNNSSMPEVAGEAGLFVDPFDSDSIRDGLEKMITDHEFRNSLAAKAKECAAKFNWDLSAKKLVDVFERAIKVRGAGI